MAQLLAARRERLTALRDAGIDPYPPRARRTHTAAEAVAAFEAVEAAGGEEGPTGIAVCGRLIGALRRMGGSMFVHVQDQSGTVQLHLRRDRMGEAAFADAAARFDPGDFVQADGAMFRTRKGEISVAVDALVMLSKSLRPLPEKWRGLTDVETRLRQRYLDLMSNEAVRARFIKRSLIVRSMRNFLDGRDFLEVETPTLQPLYGGGVARPFETRYHALDQTMFLRIADELYLKRCLVGGLERVYEICKDFRNEGIDRTHMPEFTMMECYWAYADYHDVMALVEEMVSTIALEVNGSYTVTLDDDAATTIDLTPPWRRWTVRDAVLETTGIDIAAHDTLSALRAAVDAADLHVAPQPTWAKLVDTLVGTFVEPACIQPTFLMDHPVALSPLAKRKPDDPRWAERFEPLVAGFELGNSFSELNDPLEQRERFEETARQRAAGDDEQPPIDEDFIEALMHGMPPTGGLGIGVDRLVMVLTGTMNIREVVLFPAMRTD
ncbi:MAG: lysine--tRNA ligase [Ardenticatenales bacterium]